MNVDRRSPNYSRMNSKVIRENFAALYRNLKRRNDVLSLESTSERSWTGSRKEIAIS